MSEDILDRYREHMAGVTMYEGRTPTLLDDMAAEVERLRAQRAGFTGRAVMRLDEVAEAIEVELRIESE